jgi:precorrin-6A synthase
VRSRRIGFTGRQTLRKLLIIGIGAGNRDHVTVQAISALNAVDVFFTIDKGDEKAELNCIRQEICETYIKDRAYRVVSAPDPKRDRTPSSYRSAVRDWHERRVEIFETMIAHELKDDETGGFLVWGDPSLYDSTLRIVQQVLARGAVAFAYDVIPGISSVQALAAAHRISLTRIGAPLRIATGRNLADGLADEFDDVVVMLDGNCSFNMVKRTDVDIYWGAYLGTADEILVAGDLRQVAGEIEKIRAAARARKGWIFDTYLLRRKDEA